MPWLVCLQGKDLCCRSYCYSTRTPHCSQRTSALLPPWGTSQRIPGPFPRQGYLSQQGAIKSPLQACGMKIRCLLAYLLMPYGTACYQYKPPTGRPLLPTYRLSSGLIWPALVQIVTTPGRPPNRENIHLFCLVWPHIYHGLLLIFAVLILQCTWLLVWNYIVTW